MTHKPPDHHHHAPIGVGKVLLALWIFACVGSNANVNAQQQLSSSRGSGSVRLAEPLAHGKSTWVESRSNPAPAALGEGVDSGRFGEGVDSPALVESENTPVFVEEQQQHQQQRQQQQHQHDNSLQAASERIRKNKNKQAAAATPKDARADLIPYAPDERSIRDAVRAPAKPAVGPKTADGLSSRLPARSLQDWKVEDIVLLATVDGNIYAADRDKGTKLWDWNGIDPTPMVETQYHPSNKSTDGSGSGPLLSDFIWIVEPSQDGALYGYTPSSIPGPSQGMQKLGVTIKDIVNDHSGYESDDPPVVYNGEKRSTVYTVDMANGHIIKAVTAGGSLVNENPGVCRQKGELDALDDEKCGPIRTLTMTRTDYTVGIHSHAGDPICTIKYSEWGPNLRDKDLQLQYSEAKGRRYIHSRHNGEIYAIDHQNLQNSNNERERKPSYKQTYKSPVVRVFDIASPIHSTSYDTPLVLLPQPLDPAFSIADNPNNQRVLISCTHSGSLYALSESVYPLVTSGAGLAECVQTGWSRDDVEFTLQDYLVGVHPLGTSETSTYQLPGIEAPDTPPTLDAPINGTPDNGEVVIMLPIRGSTRVIGFNYTQVLFAILVLCATGILGASRFMPSVSLLKKPAAALVETPNIATPIAEVPPTQQVETVPITEVERSVKFAEDVVDKENQPPVAPDKLDATDATDATKPADSDAAAEDAAKQSKKKAHRGKRGGKKEAEKRALKATMEQEEIDGIVEGVKQMNQNVSLTPDVIYQSTSDEKDAPAGLLNLEIQTDRILGHGSGGTLVFEGKFEGRDVAVKRMLGQYSELASQEVSLLEQSEDHPNVIRYFCRRQDEHFLYIALELCQASLWEIYRDGRRDEVPEKYNALLAEIQSQPNKVLRQLAEGLKHLHAFRIVHRDIKPQNMLIAYPKKQSTAVFPRVVISDFGLCKSLPEGASTLIGATVSAGTIGWKAPELITQPRENSGLSASNHSTGKDSQNGDFAGALGIKRSTDIFSLGCVFFYVLTGGQHPFDDEEGWMGIRERNIKADKCNLEAVSIHGPDTVDLIRWMLEPKPEDRPTAAEVLAHPFFWNAEDRLEFLSLTSDRFDMEARDGTSAALATLESYAEDIIGAGPTTISLSSASASSRYTSSSANLHHRSSSSSHEPNGTSSYLNIPMPGEPNFLAALDKKFIDTLGKQRKYQGHKVVDLLRALRNKHHHWDDMPDDVKQRVGAVPEGYLRYWEQRFPKLTVRMWRVVRDLRMSDERRYWRWYGGRVE